jgi:hypothetical protein
VIRRLPVAGILLSAVAVAVMPLGGLFSGGVFETWVGGNQFRPPVRVLVHDETGLVRAAIGMSEDRSVGKSPMAVTVPISGDCGTRVVHLAFRHTSSDYVIQQRNDGLGCVFFDLWGWGSVSLMLWAPVDSSVRLESRYDERLL